MSEAVAKLLKKYHKLSDAEQAQFLVELEPTTLAETVAAEPGFQEFLAERLAEAEDRSKLLTKEEFFAGALEMYRSGKS